MPRAVVLLLAVAMSAAAPKAPPTGRGESESIEVTASLYSEREAIKELVGTDLDGHYTVIEVRVASRFGREIDVRRDDFVLRTEKDGERSGPFAPSQIAGNGALVVSPGGISGGGTMVGPSGPAWGGVPGTNSRPRRLGGEGAGSGGEAVQAQTKAESGEGRKAPPLQKLLEEKLLPEGKTEKSLSGLLYFPLEKQKVKDLVLTYAAADGKITLRFKK